jgi:hypothetical protein
MHLLSSELDSGHFDDLVPDEENERSDIFDDVRFHRQFLLKEIPPDSNIALCILIFYSI